MHWATGFHLTPRQAHGLEGADVLLAQTAAETVIADKGYDAQALVLELLPAQGKGVVIASCGCKKATRDYDLHLYQARHLIENFFAKLKQCRAIATRYDKTARNFLGAIRIARLIDDTTYQKRFSCNNHSFLYGPPVCRRTAVC